DLLNHRWSQLVLHDFERRTQAQQRSLPRPAMIVMARAAIAMADELLREIYIHNSASLAALRQKEEQPIAPLSVAWYRILYGADPSGNAASFVELPATHAPKSKRPFKKSARRKSTSRAPGAASTNT